MAKKRTSRRSTQGAKGRSPRASRRPPPAPRPKSLQYKVVELSSVDEASLERTLNEWTPHGWRLENVQFAMRESSKRPSMAFVFFTREAEAEEVEAPDAREAHRRLVRLSEQGPTAGVALGEESPLLPPRPVESAWERLRQLAEEDDEGGGA